MKRWLTLPIFACGALALAAIGTAASGDHGRGKATSKGGTLVFDVVTTDHGCGYRSWATDKVRRVYKVRQREDGSYVVRQLNAGRFTTLPGESPSADPCAGVIRRGKHGHTLKAGMKGTMHGYLQGTVTGGTFNPDGSCTAVCSSADFIKGYFSADAAFTCSEGYAGCRFEFEYTSQRYRRQHLRYHHWVDRGLDGVHEIFIGDIANA